MSKRFLASFIQEQSGLTGEASYDLATALINAIKVEITREGRFTVPDFGSFIVREIALRRNRINPRTGEKIIPKPSATVRFKASPALKADALASIKKRARRKAT